MLLKFEDFVKAAKAVEEILELPPGSDLKQAIIEKGSKCDSSTQREFYRHMNSLFLNVLLNRLDELGEKAEARSLEARMIIAEILRTP